jgi:GTP 3',8-cyclase
MPQLKDKYGRDITYLRISLTDRCNFRCVYCMPEEGITFRPKFEILTFEEITRLVRIFHSLGVTKFRLTGGEPLVRRDVPLLVRMLRDVGDIRLYMTTNGYFLRQQAKNLKESGLTGLNISLDSLRPERVFQISRRHYLPEILNGIDAALDAGFEPIKINSVLIRGINDDEIADFAAWTKDFPFFIRFIEYMPYRDNQWEAKKVVTGQEIAKRLSELYPDAHWFEGDETDGVSSLVRIPRHRGAIGFINPMTDKFCASCNRVRLTAEGQLRLCLFSEIGCDLKFLLRNGSADEEIAETILATVYDKKPASNPLPNAQMVNVKRYMVEVGG